MRCSHSRSFGHRQRACIAASGGSCDPEDWTGAAGRSPLGPRRREHRRDASAAAAAPGRHEGLVPDWAVIHTGAMTTGQYPRHAQLGWFLVDILTFALSLGAACVPPSPRPAGGVDSGVDASDGVAYSGYGTCEPNELTFGTCVLGEQFSCSTWEHDHCGVCLKVGREGHFVAIGPHAVNCSELASCSTIGDRRLFRQWNGPSLCCTCDGSDATLRWTCEEASSCP